MCSRLVLRVQDRVWDQIWRLLKTPSTPAYATLLADYLDGENLGSTDRSSQIAVEIEKLSLSLDEKSVWCLKTFRCRHVALWGKCISVARLFRLPWIMSNDIMNSSVCNISLNNTGCRRLARRLGTACFNAKCFLSTKRWNAFTFSSIVNQACFILQS